MKSLKNLFAFLILCALLLISCSQDSNNSEIEPNFDVVGLWDLTEVQINPAQDINGDGTGSSNILDELDCISGELLINRDLTWTLTRQEVSITPITGGLFNFDCVNTTILTTTSGNWFSDDRTITFTGGIDLSSLRINGSRLIDDIGESLPGFQSMVWELRP